MNNKATLLMMLILLGWLAACGGETNPGLQSTPTAPNAPRPTVTNAPLTEGGQPYPPPQPTAAPQLGYELPTPKPTVNPYPAGLVWLIKPIGEQCQEPAPEADLSSAIAELEEDGVTVEASGITAVTVCASCGCPTSNHYRALVSEEFPPQAEAVGWV